MEVPAESSIGYCRWRLHLRQPKARQITADLLRATGDALASAVENRMLEDQINAVLVGSHLRGGRSDLTSKSLIIEKYVLAPKHTLKI